MSTSSAAAERCEVADVARATTHVVRGFRLSAERIRAEPRMDDLEAAQDVRRRCCHARKS